ncbi:MAG: DUF3048 domain-containing protein, partial [Clostridia bacterium]|nr:DUF3048 domain-containing protein [Clostridia bacterium]
MKSSKDGSSLRMVATLLIAVTIACTVGFAAGGMHSNTNTPNDNNNENNENGTPNDEVPPIIDVPQEPIIPDFTSYLTGLEITEDEALKIPLCYVIDTSGGLYGISGAQMIIEIPTDDGSTRMLAYINDLNKTATKIGAIAPTRNYISNMVKYFGGMLISNGKDDVIEYSYHDTKSACTDLSEHKGYYYSEYGRYVYTNANLIEALASTSGISLGAMGTPTMPFRFNDFGSDPLKLGELAGSVKLEYSQSSSVEFVYKSDGKYALYRNGINAIDTRNGELLSYDNVFVLYADATTYERLEGSQTVVDTIGSGIG